MHQAVIASASASSHFHPRTERPFKALRISLNIGLAIMMLGAIAACAQLVPDAMQREQQWKFDSAVVRCQQGIAAYCKQIANGGNYAH
jgi:hypothetical protein